MRIVEIKIDVLKLYSNRHAKNQPVDIIGIYHFGCIGVHIFLCSDAHFSVQKKAIMLFYWRALQVFGKFSLCSGTDE